MRFARFQSGGFITVIVVNPPKSKQRKRTSMHCVLPWMEIVEYVFLWQSRWLNVLQRRMVSREPCRFHFGRQKCFVWQYDHQDPQHLQLVLLLRPVILDRKNGQIKVTKVHIFWEGHTILKNLHRRFDRYYTGQILGSDFAKISCSSHKTSALKFIK